MEQIYALLQTGFLIAVFPSLLRGEETICWTHPIYSSLLLLEMLLSFAYSGNSLYFFFRRCLHIRLPLVLKVVRLIPRL